MAPLVNILVALIFHLVFVHRFALITTEIALNRSRPITFVTRTRCPILVQYSSRIDRVSLDEPSRFQGKTVARIISATTMSVSFSLSTLCVGYLTLIDFLLTLTRFTTGVVSSLRTMGTRRFGKSSKIP